MMDLKTQKKWDSAAGLFDLMGGFGPEKRWKPHKERLFSGMEGQILFLAVGTGLDIPCFPPGKEIVGMSMVYSISISVRKCWRRRSPGRKPIVGK